MTKASKLLILLGLITLGYVAVRCGPFLWARSQVPMTFDEADFNKDGTVSLGEAEYIASSGTREVIQDGRTCTEFFAYKDGLTLKIVCP